ncbi:hypothetical protein KFK09_004478 [Dendrobium nobile]|uniref:Uncharacterized protein n=1 Tax=Dendrobium nobile TaxID=94219 RepID=A0A8T3C6C4_DENNO|nr:hypothetical protein KFK09_004478 [Dendrobium nobile]
MKVEDLIVCLGSRFARDLWRVVLPLESKNIVSFFVFLHLLVKTLFCFPIFHCLGAIPAARLLFLCRDSSFLTCFGLILNSSVFYQIDCGGVTGLHYNLQYLDVSTCYLQSPIDCGEANLILGSIHNTYFVVVVIRFIINISTYL